PAYSNLLAHYFALYLLDSNTGRVLWQHELVQAGALQDASVLGADSQFIYIATRSLQNNQVAQLIALDKSTGMIEWRVYGPRGQANAAPDFGAVLMQGSFIYWQVDNTVYALSTQTGQIEWRDAIAEVTPRVSVLEERQMAASAGVLLIRRSDMYHALDLMTGSERWTLSGLGVDDQHMPGGVIAAGNKFILYGGGSIEAYDSVAQKVLWKHSDLVAVSNVSISPDSSLVYAVVFNRVAGGANAQALVAFDINTNLVHWTFQPDAQARLVYAGSRIIYTARGMIYATACYTGSQGNCNRQVLYGIDEKTGATHWKIEALRIYDTQLSQDGTTLTFQTSSSAWENLRTLLRG
ncbi:MAG: PQQ-binding-like beta-propeller repeat protein, partial [Ktedonobacteraceae bacterium]